MILQGIGVRKTSVAFNGHDSDFDALGDKVILDLTMNRIS